MSPSRNRWSYRTLALTAGAALLLVLATPGRATAQSENDWDPLIPRMYGCYGYVCEYFASRFWDEEEQQWVYDRGETIITYDCTGVWYYESPYWEDNSWVEGNCVLYSLTPVRGIRAAR